jgi:hypothetical protein
VLEGGVSADASADASAAAPIDARSGAFRSNLPPPF